ncbi:MAG TPA: hypothetical protein DCP92_08735 [Nitrospiraceae bacterium]|jgi:hypothetical protein|nr:hypothetical protein [Nitrospiraceae bacterium]
MVKINVGLKANGDFVRLLRIVLGIAFMVLLGSKLEAAEWLEITRNASGTAIYYLDDESVHHEGNKVLFWDKRKVSDDPDFNEISGYTEMDCKEFNYRTLQIIGYDKNGKSFTDHDAGQWQHIDANTAMAVFYGYVCKE